MSNIFKYLIALIMALLISINLYADEKIEHKIAVLVNESVITSYDIIQRMKLAAIINSNQVSSPKELE